MTQTTLTQSMNIGINLDISEGSFDGRTPTFKDLQAMAQAAEHNGLDSLWLADHLIYRFPGQDESAPWEAFTMLSALAPVTTQIELGSIVACTSFRPPALLAKMADALDEISSGRFALEGGPDGATCQRTTASADITLSSTSLGAISLGGVSARMLADARLIEENTPGAVDKADALFRWPVPPWCSTFF